MATECIRVSMRSVDESFRGLVFLHETSLRRKKRQKETSSLHAYSKMRMQLINAPLGCNNGLLYASKGDKPAMWNNELTWHAVENALKRTRYLIMIFC